MSKFKVIPPEEIERARFLYEETATPVADIALKLGIGVSTLMKYRKLWNWTPRNLRLAELDAAAKANVPLEKVRDIAKPAKKTLKKMSLHARVRAAVESEIVAIENALAQAEFAHLRSTDAERAARTLSTLVRTLKDMALLEKPDTPRSGEKSEEQFRDIDEFRSKLAERLDRLRASAET